MEGHYFDIETYSPGEVPNPETDKIVSVQFQKIDLKSGEPIGRLQVLKEWEDGEEEIVKLIYRWFFRRNPWEFVPVGFNLNFEWKFLSAKFRKYGLDDKEFGHYLENVPQIDLKVFAVLKKGGFVGASLSSISSKEDDGHLIKEYYENGDYDKILDYIENETCGFLELYKKIVNNVDKLI